MATNPRHIRSGFNFLGLFYNPLKRFFLQNNPEKAIRSFIPKIRPVDFALVVGGGADNTLIELFNHDKANHVTHVDISWVLSEEGSNRWHSHINYEPGKVSFRVTPFLDFKGKKFDAVIFPFYLDLFQTDEVMKNIYKAKEHLVNGGFIYVIDFYATSFFDRFKIWVLYFLFSPFTGVFRSKLPKYEKLFAEAGFEKYGRTWNYKDNYQMTVFKATNES